MFAEIDYPEGEAENGDFFEDSFDSEEKSKILSSYTFSFEYCIHIDTFFF